MIALPARLVVFWLVVTAGSVAMLVRGLGAEDRRAPVYTVLGVLGIVSFLVFLVGWVRQSRRQR